ncbi:MAG TPA: prolyl oligopeptidase family serine peptidase [Gemmatimonadaceae bacterium]|jgi:hypothetical protein|nr:prolyl oligopeptidase family serine peptidase [Gemmatimonadaceae bacterium]
MRKIATALVFAVAAAFPVAAHAQKKALTQADWDKWKSINAPALSPDGKWAVYTIVPQVGDGELVIRSTSGSTEYHVPRGYIGRPNNTPGGLRGPAGGTGEEAPAGPATTPAQITADSRYVLVNTEPTQAEVMRAPRGRGAAPERQSLVIVSLADGKTTTLAGVRSFRLAKDNGTWLAYVPAPDSAAGDSTGSASAGGAAAGGGRGGRGGGRGGRGGGGAAGGRRQFGGPLVLRNLSTGSEERIADVLAYTFDDSAKFLGYTVVSRDSTKDGAFLRAMSNGTTNTLLAGNGDYKALEFDRTASQLLFLSDKSEFGHPGEKPRYALYGASVKGGAAQEWVSPSQVPAGLHIADNSPVAFTRSGTAVTLNIAAPPIDSVPPDSLVGKAVFDLWHYKDETLQPTQKINATRDRNKSYEAVFFPATKKLVRLADDSVPTVALSEDAKVGVANSRERYMIEQMWGDGGTDVYIIDPTTGARKLIREKINGNATLSPDAKYAIFYDKKHWYTYNLATGKTNDLTASTKSVHFDNETDDHPAEPPAWGVAGWTKGDNTVLIYDHYDIWQFDPNGGKAPVVLTDSVGRNSSIQFRLAEGGGGGRGGGRGGRGGGAGGGGGIDERGVIDPNQPVMLRATNTETMASGFYRTTLSSRKAPEKIVMSDVAYGAPVKAANADEWMVTKGTFVQFPNLWVGPSLTNLTQVSDANPQQKDYNWGTAELVHWTSDDGVELKGILYKPENFDPNKKYPMISYFYEILSNTYNNYVPPTGRNIINPTHYVSNGYLVFEPDIVYEDGYPGPSAERAIVSGVNALIRRGFVDEKHLGIQGHSWGGYQTAYTITQTHMFAAAMAGAPVANMTSAYSGIRWGTGIARQGQYESGQSRIGKPLSEAPQLYIENSPLFFLDRVTTPLLIMSDDADDAVPWYQGIEMFLGMRRLGKEVYMIDYNNDVHNPASRANQKDIAMRMQQFFDNKLKGAPEPDWMVHGIPYVNKGKDQLAPTPVQAGTVTPQPKKQ